MEKGYRGWLTLPTGLILLTSSLCSYAGKIPVSFPEHVEALGQSRARIERVYNRLCSAPLDDLEFVLSDVHFHLTRRFTNYSGDISGRLFGALNAVGPVIGQKTPMLDVLARVLPDYQHKDGHFGAEQDLTKSINQARDMAILWGNGRLLLAMAEYCRENSDQKLLATAKRLGEYVISTRPYYGRKENFTGVGGIYAEGFTTCYPSLIDGLTALGEVTNEKRFYDEARFIGQLSLLDKKFAKHHSHGRLTAYRGMLELDRATGTHQFVDAVSAGVRHITEKLLLPTAGVTEIFDINYPADEGCSEADWVRVNLLLWQATGESSYLDMVENSLRNHLLATQCSNGGFGHHTFEPLSDSGNSYQGGRIASDGIEAYWCCSMHAGQILAELARWSVLASDDAILITWLSEVRARLTIANKIVTVTTKQLSPSLWKVQLNATGKAGVTLRLRVPGWADGLTVNGKTRIATNGWVDVPCEWSGSMGLEVGLGDDIRLAGVYQTEPKDNEPVRILAGADLFCLPDVYVGEELLADDAVPTIILATKRSSNGQIPVIIKGGSKSQKANLVAMSNRPRGGCRFLFNVRRVDTKTFEKIAAAGKPATKLGVPVELMFACSGEYEIYFNGERALDGHYEYKGWQYSQPVVFYTDKRSNVVAVKAKAPARAKRPGLIGLVRVDKRVYETSPDGWSAVPCEEISGEQAEKLVDLGGFGAAPWKHIPAQFAGTSARWIWPKVDNQQQCWLFRYSFEIKD